MPAKLGIISTTSDRSYWLETLEVLPSEMLVLKKLHKQKSQQLSELLEKFYNFLC